MDSLSGAAAGIFASIWSRTEKQASVDNLLIVGLGNPGPEYAGSRHNLGIDCVSVLAKRLGVSMTRRRWRSLVGFVDLTPQRRVWLAWPQTYMNLSGEAVAAAVRDQVREKVADALELALESGIQAAMDRYNRAGSLGCEEIP